MIKFNVEGQVLSIASQPNKIVTGTKDYLSFSFEFKGNDWDNHKKIVTVEQGDTIKRWELINDKVTADRHIDLTEGNWEVSLYRTEGTERITTNIVGLNVIGTGDPKQIGPHLQK